MLCFELTLSKFMKLLSVRMKIVKKRTTIYFDHSLHQYLRLKAADMGQSVSELVNQAVRLFLAEDTEDMAAFAERRHEPDLPFEDVLKDLRLRGKI
jgi:hypothetical protein